MPEAHAFSQGIGLLIVLYLAILLIIARRLKTAHNGVWMGLGSPGLLHWSVSSSFRLGGYVFFRGDYRTLGDVTLERLIWAVRALVVVTLVAIVIWLTYYRGGALS